MSRSYRDRARSAKSRLVNTPELKEQRNATRALCVRAVRDYVAWHCARMTAPFLDAGSTQCPCGRVPSKRGQDRSRGVQNSRARHAILPTLRNAIRNREDIMTSRNHSIRTALLAGTMLAAVGPAIAADVTPDRLVNADKEPQNWLMNHRTYDGQRFSPLDAHQPGHRQRPQARLHGRARRRGGERIRDGDAARRRRLSLHHRLGGRALQDRRPLGRRRPHRVAHGSRAGKAGPQPRRRPVGQSRRHGRRRAAAHHRHQQGHREGGVGNHVLGYARRSP